MNSQKKINKKIAVLPFLTGRRVILRPLRREDAYGPYLAWFNDSEVCQGNAHHRFPFVAKEARAYIERSHISRNELVLAIVTRGGHKHIGNIAIKRIDYINRSAEFAIVLGDKNFWGKGYSQEASRLLLDHAFFALNLNRVFCGTFELNNGMRKLAIYLGMREEGRRRQAIFKANRFLDVIEYGVLRSEYAKKFGCIDGN